MFTRHLFLAGPLSAPLIPLPGYIPSVLFERYKFVTYLYVLVRVSLGV